MLLDIYYLLAFIYVVILIRFYENIFEFIKTFYLNKSMWGAAKKFLALVRKTPNKVYDVHFFLLLFLGGLVTVWKTFC